MTIHRSYGDGTMFHVWCIFAVVSIVTAREKVSYRGSQLMKVHIPNHELWREFTRDLDSLPNKNGYDVWKFSEVANKTWADLHISEEIVDSVRDLLLRHDLEHHVIIDDVGKHMEIESTGKRRQKRSVKRNDVLDHYAGYDEIITLLEKMAEKHPDVAKVIDIGTTSENRKMKVLKLGVEGRHKWKIWIDGGTHAREWISPANVLFLATKLLNGYLRGDRHYVEYLETLDWYFLPVVNPDGYEYSHSTDRLWRKNRKHHNGTECHGVDLNRNWDFQWGGPFSSSDPCQNLYKGDSPGDENEVRNIVNFLLPRAGAFIAFITYHSYGQRFTTRWDYSRSVLPEDHDQLMSLAKRAVLAMQRVNGVSYEPGRAPELMYPFGGGSADWARAIANIKYSYLIELRNVKSFILPPEEIVPTGEENWAAVRVIAREIIRYYSDIPAPHYNDPEKKFRQVVPVYSHNTGSRFISSRTVGVCLLIMVAVVLDHTL